MSDDTGSIISYEDACDRVGRELFGDEWDITLSDDEWSEYDAGPWAPRRPLRIGTLLKKS